MSRTRKKADKLMLAGLFFTDQKMGLSVIYF